MKKFLTFAIVAFLLGGFAFNANAQDRKAQNQSKKQTVSSQKANVGTVTKDSVEKMVKDYEKAVDKCISTYKATLKGDDTAKTANFNKVLAETEALKAKLDKSKDLLSKDQSDRVERATQKLAQVYKKG